MERYRTKKGYITAILEQKFLEPNFLKGANLGGSWRYINCNICGKKKRGYMTRAMHGGHGHIAVCSSKCARKGEKKGYYACGCGG